MDYHFHFITPIPLNDAALVQFFMSPPPQFLFFRVYSFLTGTQPRTAGLFHRNADKGKGKGKAKAVPLQAWTGPVGSRRLNLPDFKPIGTCRW